ncbi:MAG TPA: ankyrin repeat domain-containing protein, partial [bacterium]|nr:ankyrin repeat domain-containing protein [bacterium]
PKSKNINFSEKTGKTALHFAVEYNRLDMVKALVNSGASVDVKDSSGNTPENTATQRNLKDIIDFFKSTKKI